MATEPTQRNGSMPIEGGRRNPTRAFGRMLAPSMFALAAMFFFAACGEDETAGPEAGITVGDVTDEPADFTGETVMVSGAIGDIVGQRAFTLEDDGLLVVGAQTLPQWLGPDFDEDWLFDDDGDWDELEDRVAMVRGTVRPFKLAEVERELGVDLDDGLFADYEDDPAIVAQSVRILFQAEDIDDEAEFAGRTLSVTGEVSEVIDPRAFRMGGDDGTLGIGADDGLLVIGAKTLPQWAGSDIREDDLDALEDRTVVATGTVRRFVLVEVEEELDIDLDDEIYVEFEGEPVLVARQVQLTFPDQGVEVSVADLADEPDMYEGLSVTIQGTVTEVLSAGAFLVNNEVVVLNTGNPAMSVVEGKRVQVKGVVHDFEALAGFPGLAEEIGRPYFAPYEEFAAVMATSIEMT
jgi:hypothetical protein